MTPLAGSLAWPLSPSHGELRHSGGACLIAYIADAQHMHMHMRMHMHIHMCMHMHMHMHMCTCMRMHVYSARAAPLAHIAHAGHRPH